MMLVFSPLALYTTFLGWQQYDVIFEALWQTGILYFGFIVLVWRYLYNVLAPTSPHQTAEIVLNYFLIELAKMVLICGLFVYPSISLEQKGLTFKPICTFEDAKLKGANSKGQIQDSTIKDTGTTYDEDFADVLSASVKIPLGFSLIQNLSSSATYGLMKVGGCTDSLSEIKGDLVSTHIPHALKKQIQDFHQQCFLEARNQYLNETRTEAEQKKVDDVLKTHGGEEDVNWLGSEVFKASYYQNIKAKSPVEGFPYESNEADNFENAKSDAEVSAHKPTNGYPSCAKWWDKIEGDLVNASNEAPFYDAHLGSWSVKERIVKYKDAHKVSWNTKITAEDFIARILLEEGTGLQIESNDALIQENNGNFGKSLSRGLVNTGQWFKSWSSTPLKREATIQSLPIMQAFFYFFLIILTPIVLALSAYSPKALGSLCGLYFMTIFIQYLWHITSFLERATVNSLGESNVVSAMQNIAVLFYYIAPIILLKLSSYFGGVGGAALGDLIGSAQNVGNEAAHSAKQIGSSAVSVASKGAIRL